MRTTVEIVEILENYLKEKKISRRQFCALVDIPNTTISSWKKKNTLPSIEFMSKIAAFMNVSLDWLVNGDMVENQDNSLNNKSMNNKSMVSGVELINHIDEVLEDLSLTRKDFAKKLGLSPSTMAAWKTNNSLPTVDTITIIAQDLNVTTDWLLNGNPGFEERESVLSHHSREQVRSRIYKRLIEKFKITENTDNLKQLHHDWFDPGYESYEYLLNWSKGRNEIDYTTFVFWANCLDTTVQYLFTGEQSEMPAYFDKYTYEVAMKNQIDLFCLHNLSGDRKQAAHIMLNQFMKLEHQEIVDKNKKDNQ